MKYLAVACLIIAPCFTNASGDGDWISSGGDAVLCYKSLQEAKSAEEEILSNGTLSDSKIDAAQSISSLDLFSSNEHQNFSWAYIYNDFNALKENRLKAIGRESPILELYLRLIEKGLQSSKWEDTQNLNEIDDSLDRKQFRILFPYCVISQAIERRSQREKDKIPKFALLFRSKIWLRMPVAEQVSLYLHELFYSIGKEIDIYSENNHHTSKDIMILVRSTMSNRLPSNREYRRLINQIYGDYILLFSTTIKNSNKSPVNYSQPTQQTRFLSYQAFIAEARDFINKCHEYRSKNPPPQNKPTLDCKDLAMHPQRVLSYLETLQKPQKLEQSFMYFSVHIWDMSAKQINSEDLMSWPLETSPTHQTTHKNKTFKNACALLQLQEFNETPWTNSELKIRDFALDYCNNLMF